MHARLMPWGGGLLHAEGGFQKFGGRCGALERLWKVRWRLFGRQGAKSNETNSLRVEAKRVSSFDEFRVQQKGTEGELKLVRWMSAFGVSVKKIRLSGLSR